MTARRIILAAACLLPPLLWAAQPKARDALPPLVSVVRVVDGDTVVVEGDDGKRSVVRLVGVDTPETKHPSKPVEPHGPEASAFTEAGLLGREVRLVPDSRAGERDRYGRTLAYVFVGDECFNETLIRRGHGRACTDYPFEAATRARFLIVEDAARAAGRGLWGEGAAK